MSGFWPIWGTWRLWILRLCRGKGCKPRPQPCCRGCTPCFVHFGADKLCSLLELVRLDSRAVPFLGLETGLAVATVVSLLVAAAAAVAVVVRRLRVRSPAL